MKRLDRDDGRAKRLAGTSAAATRPTSLRSAGGWLSAVRGMALIGIVICCLPATKLLPATNPRPAASLLVAGHPAAREAVTTGEIVVETSRVLLPCIGAQALDAGGIATSPATGSYAVKVTVTPSDDEGEWVLWMEASEPWFRSADGEKSCRDLLWKHDDESASAYRPVTEDGVPVFKCGAGEAEIHLDLMVAVDWRTAPGAYRLGLGFRLQSLE